MRDTAFRSIKAKAQAKRRSSGLQQALSQPQLR